MPDTNLTDSRQTAMDPAAAYSASPGMTDMTDISPVNRPAPTATGPDAPAAPPTETALPNQTAAGPQSPQGFSGEAGADTRTAPRQATDPAATGPQSPQQPSGEAGADTRTAPRQATDPVAAGSQSPQQAFGEIGADTRTAPRQTTDPAATGPQSPQQAPADSGSDNAGTIKISVVSSVGMIPVENATVTLSYTGDPGAPLKILTTDSSGQTPVTELPAPPLELSLQPENEQQPYSEYNIEIAAEGYEPVLISGSEIFSGELSLQPVRMNPLAVSEEDEKIVIIPAHTLFGNFPPKIPEEEIKPMAETGEIVLSRVVIPEYVIVHDGVPSDSTASNYWVRYKDYIKNVASCEIYSTWPENALYANILAIMSFTLNRVYTEWYGNHH